MNSTGPRARLLGLAIVTLTGLTAVSPAIASAMPPEPPDWARARVEAEAEKAAENDSGADAAPGIADDTAAHGGCLRLHFDGEPAALGAPEPAPAPKGQLGLSPLPCGQVDGWAGHSIALGLITWGFSADSSQFVHCNGACRFVWVATGKTISRIDGDLDQAPEGDILKSPAIAGLAKTLGIPAAQGRWDHPDVDLVWRVSRDEGTLRYLLRDRATGTTEAIATFTAKKLMPKEVAEGAPTFILEQWPQLSPDGKTLAVVALIQSGQSFAVFPKRVALTAALAKLYTRAARAHPKQRAELEARKAALGAPAKTP